MAITPRGRAPTAATGERPEENRGYPAMRVEDSWTGSSGGVTCRNVIGPTATIMTIKAIYEPIAARQGTRAGRIGGTSRSPVASISHPTSTRDRTCSTQSYVLPPYYILSV